MGPLASAALGALLAPAALLWLHLLRRSLRPVGDLPWLLRPGAPDVAPARVVAVVPARDEVHDIAACVRALLAQELPGAPPLEVVVLDDGSTDGTAEVLDGLRGEAAGRLTVISGGGGPLPEGWMGKPWACERAGREALRRDPDWLLFVDADVRLHPQALRAALHHAQGRRLDLLSGYGALLMVSFWEKVVQPAVVTLLLLGRPLSVVNDLDRADRPPMANGQFMLFRRAAWEGVGGHGAVRGDVLDDVGMARVFLRAQLRSGVVLMPELFQTRMYTTFAEIWEGWTKNLFPGLERRWDRLAGAVAFVIWATLLPWLVLPLGLLGLIPALPTGIAAVAVAASLALRLRTDRLSGQDLRFAASWPLGFLVLTALLVGSALRTTRGTATWKGRRVLP